MLLTVCSKLPLRPANSGQHIFRDNTFSVLDWQGGCMQHEDLHRYLVRVWQESSAAWHRRHASVHRWLIRASRAAPRPCPSSCCRPAVARVTTPTCCCPLMPFTSLLHCLNISQQLQSRRQSLSTGIWAWHVVPCKCIIRNIRDVQTLRVWVVIAPRKCTHRACRDVTRSCRWTEDVAMQSIAQQGA